MSKPADGEARPTPQRAPLRAGLPRVRVTRTRRAAWLFTLNRLLLYTVLLAYVPGVLVLAGGLVAVAYFSIVWTFPYLVQMLTIGWFLIGLLGLWALSLGLAALLMLLGLLPLFFRELDDQPEGERLSPRQEPRFDALVRRLCQRLNIPPPDLYLLTWDDNASIGDLDYKDEQQRLIRKVRTLSVGAALVVRTRVDELATLLCHELAHAAAGDTRMSRRTHRFFQSMCTLVYLHEDEPEDEPDFMRFVLRMLLSGYFYLFLWLYARECRYHELRADRVAAEICGPQNVRNMLMKAHLTGCLPELDIIELCRRFSEEDADPASLYREYEAGWAAVPPERRALAENEMFLEQTDMFGTHPCLSDRIRNLTDVRTKELANAQPATALFRFWEHLETKLTRRLMRWGRAEHKAMIAALNRALDRRQYDVY